jgi:hypothetical protein
MQSATIPIFISNVGNGLLNYTSIVFDTTGSKMEMPDTDNLTGSAMTCSATSLISGEPLIWTLTAQNQSTGIEAVNHIKTDFPPGMTIASATSFHGGTGGALSFLGNPGFAPTLSWHGETPGGNGVLLPGESAQAVISGNTAKNFLNDLFIVYNILGDSNGPAPHNQAGAMVVRNPGLPNSWLNLSDISGQLRRNESATVTALLRTEGLTPGIYRCRIILKDYFNNKAVIPVTLRIPFPVGNYDAPFGESLLFKVSPNPVSGVARFSFRTPVIGRKRLVIRDAPGIEIRRWELPEDLTQGFFLTWDGKDAQGRTLPSGVYFGTLETTTGTKSLKVVLIR